MAIFISRLILIWLSGWLMSSGWINDGIQQTLLTDPDIANALQVAISGIAMGVWFWVYRQAKRRGWTT